MGSADNKYSFNKKKPGKTKAFFICMVIASFLWLIHSLNTVYNYTIKVPLSIKNLPPNKKTLSEIPSALYVHVKASGLKLCLILLNRPFSPIEIDFNNLKSINRNQSYILSSGDIDFEKSFKFSARITHISPDTLYFSESTGYQKVVPLKAPLYIKCREGYGLKKPVINPSFITIWGDTALIKKIDTIYTQPLNLDDVFQDLSSKLTIIKPDPELYANLNETNIKIEVVKLVEQSITVPVNAVYKQSNRQVNIYPSKVKIRFTCLQNDFDQQDTALFRIVVNGDKIDPVTKKSTVFLSAAPANITVMSIEPKEVEILILKKP